MTQLAKYDFTGTNGAAVNTGTGDTPGCTLLSGVASIQSNALQFASDVSAPKLALLSAAAVALGIVDVQITIKDTADSQGIFFWQSGALGAENGYYIYFNFGTWSVVRYDAGTPTTILAETWAGGTAYYQNIPLTFRYDPTSGNAVLSVTDGTTTLGPVTDSSAGKRVAAMGAQLWGRANTLTNYDAITINGTSAAAAATLSSPTPSGTLGTQTTATLGATTNQGTAGSNTLYGVWSTSNGFSGVTAAQVKAGQNAAGSTSGVLNGNSAISTTTPSIAISSLAPNTTYYYALAQENANGLSNVVTGSFTTAVATTSVTVGLNSAASTALASTACKFWTKNTLDGAAVDGGSAGISGTTDASGNITLSGLTIAAGAKYLQYQVGTDPLNVHVVPVTYA